MSRAFDPPMAAEPASHVPVLLSETLEILGPRDHGRYLDGTVGLAGHASAILGAADCHLLGLDRDEEALSLARERLAPFGARAHLSKGRYSAFADHLASLGWSAVDGALLDLGVSSLQLDRGRRGFSFRHDGPLDMRMGGGQGPTAADLVNGADPATLRDWLARLGEEPLADRIVRAVVARRKVAPLRTTSELAALVEACYPARWRATSRHHPATRTFQALRMVVNDELGELERFLAQILPWLAPSARLVVITFHSLEDRLVKQTMQTWARGCLCPPYVSRCTCGHRPSVRILTKKPLRAEALELAKNSRASSAKLRAVERLPETGA